MRKNPVKTSGFGEANDMERLRLITSMLLWVFTGIMMGLHIVGVAIGAWSAVGGLFLPSLMFMFLTAIEGLMP